MITGALSNENNAFKFLQGGGFETNEAGTRRGGRARVGKKLNTMVAWYCQNVKMPFVADPFGYHPKGVVGVGISYPRKKKKKNVSGVPVPCPWHVSHERVHRITHATEHSTLLTEDFRYGSWKHRTDRLSESLAQHPTPAAPTPDSPKTAE